MLATCPTFAAGEDAMTLGYVALLFGFAFAGSESHILVVLRLVFGTDWQCARIAMTLKTQQVEPHYHTNRVGSVAATPSYLQHPIPVCVMVAFCFGCC